MRGASRSRWYGRRLSLCGMRFRDAAPAPMRLLDLCAHDSITPTGVLCRRSHRCRSRGQWWRSHRLRIVRLRSRVEKALWLRRRARQQGAGRLALGCCDEERKPEAGGQLDGVGEVPVSFLAVQFASAERQREATAANPCRSASVSAWRARSRRSVASPGVT